jgi:GAF domain-containing protein
VISITRTPNRRHIFRQILPQVKEILVGPDSTEEKLQALCQVLHSGVNWYDWVGFYLVDPDTPRMLVLGPYVGNPTDHVRIPFGQGICGQAAERQETFMVDDVSEETNYLACSLHVKSEIVVPIFKDGTFVGELDIDSHSLEAFNAKDQAFLESICELVGVIL